ncbi:MAG TPA: patatin-like phospholipase family protein [Thermomicrobiales bacterium]|jgi:predicted acylesterase/phospholipase RssA
MAARTDMSGEWAGKQRPTGDEAELIPDIAARPLAPKRSPRIGLALSSGGARGFAHVGVIKALREAGFSIVNIAGSSMGSIVAAGYAVRGDVAELERWVLDFRARDYARRFLPIMDPLRLTAFLDQILGGATFADCAVPLRIIATDLRARGVATLDEGSVALAAFASSALPFVHRPIPWEGRLLADGSLSCVLPMAQASGSDVDIVIGSLVSRTRPILNGLTEGIARTAGGAIRGWSRPYFEFFRDRAPQRHWSAPIGTSTPPVVILNPGLGRIGPLDFARMREAIAAGEEAVTSRLGEIRARLGIED